MTETGEIRADFVASEDGGPLGRRATIILLALLVALALGLRLTGLSFLLPHAWEPDSMVLVRQVEYIESGVDDAERDVFFGYYPHLIARLATLAPRMEAATPAVTLEEHLQAASAERVRIRAAIATLSVLLVVGTYLLARRFLGRVESLFATGLIATSVLHLWFAQQARPHAVSSAFALFAVLGALHLRERGDLRAYALAGLTTILAVCSLQNGLAVLPALFVAHALRRRGALRFQNVAFASVLVVLAVCVRYYYPFLFAATNGKDAAVLQVEGEHLNMSGHDIELSAFDGRGLSVVVHALVDYEPLLFGLIFAGIGAWAWSRFRMPRAARTTPEDAIVPLGARWREFARGREHLIVVLAFVVPYALVLGLYARTFPRFVIPLLPYLAVFAAFGLFRAARLCVERVGPIDRAYTLGRIAACFVLLLQIWAAAKLSWIRTQPDTYRRAANWISAHVAPDERVLVGPYIDLPLFRAPTVLANFPFRYEETWPWIVHQRALGDAERSAPTWDLCPPLLQSAADRARLAADPIAFVRAHGATWALVEAFDDKVHELSTPVRSAVQGAGRLVARFSPQAVDVGDDRPIVFQDDWFARRPIWWAQLISARSCGPVLEIYALDLPTG